MFASFSPFCSSRSLQAPLLPLICLLFEQLPLHPPKRRLLRRSLQQLGVPASPLLHQHCTRIRRRCSCTRAGKPCKCVEGGVEVSKQQKLHSGLLVLLFLLLLFLLLLLLSYHPQLLQFLPKVLNLLPQTGRFLLGGLEFLRYLRELSIGLLGGPSKK